jgi:DNA-binding transcriptional MerR regulator
LDEKPEIDRGRPPLPRGNSAGCAGDHDNAELPLTIAEVAREFGITPRALRFYENKRLLAPQREGAVRLYGRRDYDRLALIVRGRRLGFTLAEIAELLGNRDGDPHALHLTRAKCVEQIKLLERRKREIEAAVTELRQIYTSFYRQAIECDDPPSPVVAPLHRKSA